jgi:hypothetical protein
MTAMDKEWAEMNPRPEWDKPEHWEACRPNHEEEATADDDVPDPLAL